MLEKCGLIIEDDENGQLDFCLMPVIYRVSIVEGKVVKLTGMKGKVVKIDRDEKQAS
jgi:hypothetical protein